MMTMMTILTPAIFLGIILALLAFLGAFVFSRVAQSSEDDDDTTTELYEDDDDFRSRA